MWLLYVSCAWVIGVFLGAVFSPPLLALSFGLIPLALIPFLPNRKKPLLLTGLCLLAFLGGGIRFLSAQTQADAHSLRFYNETGIVEIQGMLTKEPDIRDGVCLLTLAADQITVDGETDLISGTALLRVPRYPTYRYGDVVTVTGELETPPQLADFDYAGYLADRGIHSIMYYPRVEVLARGQGLKPLQWLHALRLRLSTALDRALPEPQGSLAQGILLGQRQNIPDSLQKAFSRTGTAHLLAISGLHLSIILAMVLSLGAAVFGRQRGTCIWIALGAAWLYALLVGIRPPIIRAAIMGSLFLMAESLGRQRSAIIALAFAAALMVGIQPHLLWSASFQLSFSAMAGLMLLFPYFQTWGGSMAAALFGNRKTLMAAASMPIDVLAASLSAIILTWPIIAYNFGIVSLVTLPATFLSLPALPFIIVTSALVAFVGLFALLASQILGWLAWLFLSYLLFVVQGCDALPFSSLEVSTLSAWHVWGYYAVLGVVIASVNNRDRLVDLFGRLTSRTRRIAQGMSGLRLAAAAKWLIPALLVVIILLWTAVLTAPDDRLHVSFLDVGQGDAILIQTPAGQNILIDGGPDPQMINLALSEKLPFWDRTIDLVVCTQPQADHVTGLVEVLRRYNVKQVLDPGVPYDSSIYREWLRLIEEQGIAFNIARVGQEIDLGDGITMEILNPPPEFFHGTSCDIDNNGIVLKLTWNRVSFLFTADIRPEAEFELIMQRVDLKSTVLKVAHHGSMTSTIPQFLAAVDPEVAVISVGADNRFGHPSPEVVQRLIDRVGEDNVYHTDRQGTIELITDGERLWIKTSS
ncbi:MAG: DNA internalization-related competence protein ComEC/Rec2 [Dehalococcoidia bacterium]|nr:DNA internalization-related competence protein ComEC/Rec2 [Dehalococcoidia bacterium]